MHSNSDKDWIEENSSSAMENSSTSPHTLQLDSVEVVVGILPPVPVLETPPSPVHAVQRLLPEVIPQFREDNYVAPGEGLAVSVEALSGATKQDEAGKKDEVVASASVHVDVTPQAEEEEEMLFCRICHDSSEDEELISVCNCTAPVHASCLQRWGEESGGRLKCEICLAGYPEELQASLSP